MGTAVGTLPGPQFNSNIYGQQQQKPNYFDGTYSAGGQNSAQGPQFNSQGGGDLLSQLQALFGLGQSAGAAQNQGIQQGLDQYGLQQGLIGANLNDQTNSINQNAGLEGQKLDLQGQGIFTQQGALNRQQALLPQQQALTNEGLAEQLARANFSAGQSRQNLSSQGTVNGSLQSVGSRRGFGDIATQLGFATQDVSRAQRGSDLSYAEQKAQLGDQQKNLDLAAKGLGIDKQELTNRTQSALQQLGLSSALQTSDITKAMNDLNAGRFNPIQNILPYIYQLVGVRPTAG